mmetsp:Transcript_16158/g.44146  ORF Transcript_16158/g.44146 Transcript_16158/m.44146 type:complete len:339 (+) Transcript_16158:127-1143(+)
MVFTPEHSRTVSVLHRPPSPAMSYVHVENIDIQHQKDRQAFERRAAVHRRQAGETWHNNGPGITGLWEKGHIVDRGRGKSEVQASHGVFNPILSHFVVPPVPVVGPQGQRPQSAPHVRQSSPATLSSGRADKELQRRRGVINPITGHVQYPADPQYAARKEVEFQRSYGGGGGIHTRVNPEQINPITGEQTFKPLPCTPGSEQGMNGGSGSAQKRPASAPRAPAGKREHTAAARPTTPGGGRKVMHGETWGTYNPINHVWQVPPKDSRYSDPSAMLEKSKGLSGTHVAKGQHLPNQGIYNPILNTWTVPPTNPRVIQGLSFAPATMFSRNTPSTIRTR